MSIFLPQSNLDFHYRTIIGRTMHNRILCERLQDQLRNKAGEKLVVFHMKRIFKASGIPDPENGKIILQIFQFFFDGNVFVFIGKGIL